MYSRVEIRFVEIMHQKKIFSLFKRNLRISWSASIGLCAVWGLDKLCSLSIEGRKKVKINHIFVSEHLFPGTIYSDSNKSLIF